MELNPLGNSIDDVSQTYLTEGEENGVIIHQFHQIWSRASPAVCYLPQNVGKHALMTRESPYKVCRT